MQTYQDIWAPVLAALKERSEKALFVEIESMYEPDRDQPSRIRRKHFYVKNGFVPMNVMADVFGVKMELMGFDCRLSFEEYHAFYRDNYNEWAAGHIQSAEK